jgi:ribose-phosphate pyrophosphokinase
MTEDQKLCLIGGGAHPALTIAVAKELGVDPCKISLSTFANGEISCRLGESVRGRSVFVMQSHFKNVNDSIMEQLIIIDAAKRASAASVTAVCPSLGYARQDRKSHSREPITARLIIDLFAAAGADRIIGIDLHTGQIQGFFSGPFDHLIALPLLANHIKNVASSDNLVIVSPDAGSTKTAERYSRLLGCDIAIIHKQRQSGKRGTAEAKYLIGDVKHKVCVVVDDMIDTAGTVCAAADLLMKHGATEIYGAATHPILSDPAMERIEKSAFKKIIVTDTLPLVVRSAKLEVISIAPLLAQAVSAVHEGESVSAIFDGKNQF